MVALHPYPRGFVLFPREAETAPPDGWQRLDLGACGWIFAHDPLVTPELVTVPGTNRWVLVHGLCLHAGLEDVECSPVRYLADAAARSEAAFLDALDFLGGRHVILHGDSLGFRVFHDATGMRSVYYSAEPSLVASHVNLLNDLHPHAPRTDVQGRRGAIAGWDRTPFLGISPLLPNHYLDTQDWSVHRFYPREENRYAQWTLQDKIHAFRNMWARQMTHLVNTGSKLVMSLTGGADSRTSLALSMDHVADIEMFTYTVTAARGTAWSKSMALDKKLVEEIKQLIPMNHRYFFFGEKNLPCTAEIDERMRKNTTQSHGRWLVPYYADAFPDHDVVHLRGNAYEIGRAYWGTSGGNDTLADLWRVYRGRTKKDRGHEPEKSRRADFERGVATWQYDVPLHGFRLADIFYWEVRCGRWLAEILNETDIAFETCVPINVRAMIELSLAFPVEERARGFFFSELINAGCPVLNFPGKNDERNLYEQMRDQRRQREQVTRVPMQETTATDRLLPRFTVTTEDGRRETVEAEGDRMWLPRWAFTAGTTVSRELRPASEPGELTFTVDSPYAREAALNTWYYQISVDGRPAARFDGAERRRPVHVSVDNVTPDTTVSVQIVALRDRMGLESWQRATRARITDVTATPGRVAGPPKVATDVPGSVLASGTDVLTVDIDHLEELTSADFAAEVPQRVDVVTTYCVIPLLVVKRAEAQRLTVLCNGAVDQERSQGKPVFQRSTWWPEITGHQIYVCDPATTGPRAVSLGWGQFSSDYWMVPDAARAVQAVSAALGVLDPEQRVYFGSSAGGFLALAMLYYDPKARAVANNAQFDWTRWYVPAVNTLRNARLRSMLPADLRTRYPLRTNVLQLLSTMTDPPRIDYWVNTASDHDREVDLPQMERFVTLFPDISPHIACHCYEDEDAGHNPMQQAETLKVLAEAHW